jgi:citrate lyase beta subunit
LVRVDDGLSRHPAIENLTRHDSLNGIVIPKFENPEQCAGWHKPVLAIIETPRGVVNAPHIAKAAALDLHGIALGPEDLCAALGVGPRFESIAVDGKMVDLPVVTRAQRVLSRQRPAPPASGAERV